MSILVAPMHVIEVSNEERSLGVIYTSKASDCSRAFIVIGTSVVWSLRLSSRHNQTHTCCVVELCLFPHHVGGRLLDVHPHHGMHQCWVGIYIKRAMKRVLTSWNLEYNHCGQYLPCILTSQYFAFRYPRVKNTSNQYQVDFSFWKYVHSRVFFHPTQHMHHQSLVSTGRSHPLTFLNHVR